MPTDLSAVLVDRLGMPTGLAAAIVADLEHAITEGERSTTEVWADLAADYAHELQEHVQLEWVIELVSNHYGLTAGLR